MSAWVALAVLYVAVGVVGVAAAAWAALRRTTRRPCVECDLRYVDGLEHAAGVLEGLAREGERHPELAYPDLRQVAARLREAGRSVRARG